MKIGVISDTHITEKSKHLPDAVVKGFKGVDMIVHAGDIGSAGILDTLRSLCPNVKAVWGNMDPDELKRILPEKEIFKAGKYRIAVTHGCGAAHKVIEYVQSLFKHDHVDVIIFGHSHEPCNEKRGGILFFNPGSPTDRMFAPYNSYGIIEAGDTIEGRIVPL